MIKIEKYEVVGWEHAIRGMRNPMNSWEKSDTHYCNDFDDCEECPALDTDNCCGLYNEEIACSKNPIIMGANDHELMMKLANAGDDHGKVIRYLDVYVDITAPLYWWKEFRTYRKGRNFMDDGDDFLDPDALEMHIETNSCSTMHKIHEKPFEFSDFSCEHLPGAFYNGVETEDMILVRPNSFEDGCYYSSRGILDMTIQMLNKSRERYLETKDKKYWWQMIQLLPSSYNQKRTVKLNYQVLKNMYHARKNHKLDEWRELCTWIERLPYSEIITGGDGR